MDAQRFEITMKKFFQKASVSLLKKGTNYAGYDEAPSYLLIDVKRNAYYLTETDVPSDTQPDPETISAMIILSDQTGLTADTAAAILRLGRAVDRFDGSLTVPEEDLGNLSRKSALVITEDNAEDAAVYLKSLGANFQAAPFKGAFVALFLDNDSSERLAGLYRETSHNEREEEKQSIGISDEPQEAENHHGKDDLIDESPDQTVLSFTSTSDDTEKVPEDKEEELYSKILNGHSESTEHASASINEFADAKETSQSEGNTENHAKNMLPGKKIIGEPVAQPAGYYGFNGAAIAANVSGLVFFTPYYLLGKLTSRILPPFVIYWLAAIAVILGFYKLIWSSAGTVLYGWALSSAPQAVSFSAQTINRIADVAGTAENACLMLLGYAIAFFGGQVAFLENMASGWTLGYGASFAAVLTIFPYTRQWGLRLTVWFVAIFLTFPLVAVLEEKLILRFTEATSLAVQAGSYPSLSASAAGAFFSAVILPISILSLLYALTCRLVPDHTKFKKVLP